VNARRAAVDFSAWSAALEARTRSSGREARLGRGDAQAAVDAAENEAQRPAGWLRNFFVVYVCL
jgi:hypothetical protein